MSGSGCRLGSAGWQVDQKTWSGYTDGVSKVTIHEAKAKLSSLIEEALSGEDVIIMRRNKPLVRIVALQPEEGTRRIGTARGRVEIAEDFDETPEGFEDYL